MSDDRQGVAQEENFIVLFNVAGESFPVPCRMWAEALRGAKANGWEPAGTEARPKSWALSQAPTVTPQGTGGYEEALGQLVTHADALRLAAALEEGSCSMADARALGRYCGLGSFIICRMPTDLQSEISTTDQLAKLSRQLGEAVAPANGQVGRHVPLENRG